MATDKWVARLEAKLDALLEAHDLKPEDFTATTATATAAPADRMRAGGQRELTPEEQQAIDNAPKTPTADDLKPVAERQRTDAATNAPDTSSSVPVPPEAVGNVTVETQEPDGDTTVRTMPASEAKRRR